MQPTAFLALAPLGLFLAASNPQASPAAPTPPTPRADDKPISKSDEQKPPTLFVGDAAPALPIEKWLAGKPVERLEKGRVYLVSVWGASLLRIDDEIAELARLEREKGAAGLTVIATVSEGIFKDGVGPFEKFVRERGDEIGFALGYEKDKLVDTTWREAARQWMPPNQFLVDRNGKIAWIGELEDLEPTLTQVLAGKHDLTQAAADYRVAIALELRVRAPLFGMVLAEQLEKWDKVVEHARRILELEPIRKGEVTWNLMIALGVRLAKPDEAYAFARAFADGPGKDSPEGLRNIAFSIVSPEEHIEPRDLALAERVARRAVDLTKEKHADALLTLAIVHLEKREFEQAIATARKAVLVDPARASNLEAIELHARTRPHVEAHERATQAGDWTAAAAAARKLAEVEPVRCGEYAYHVMLALGPKLGKPDEAYAFAQSFVDGPGKASPHGLNAVAWAIVDPEEHVDPRDLGLAFRTARRAVELTGEKDANMMDTLAMAHYHAGELDKALVWARRCAAIDEEYGSRVEMLERALQAKGK